MKRALVVDDSKAVRTIVRRFMTELGYEVSEAANGLEGLALLKQQPATEIALVDWNMPEMDGVGFIRAARAEAAFEKVRLLVVTTEMEVGRVAEAMESGAQGYILKPLTRDTLKEKLAGLGL